MSKNKITFITKYAGSKESLRQLLIWLDQPKEIGQFLAQQKCLVKYINVDSDPIEIVMANPKDKAKQCHFNHLFVNSSLAKCASVRINDRRPTRFDSNPGNNFEGRIKIHLTDKFNKLLADPEFDNLYVVKLEPRSMNKQISFNETNLVSSYTVRIITLFDFLIDIIQKKFFIYLPPDSFHVLKQEIEQMNDDLQYINKYKTSSITTRNEIERFNDSLYQEAFKNYDNCIVRVNKLQEDDLILSNILLSGYFNDRQYQIDLTDIMPYFNRYEHGSE